MASVSNIEAITLAFLIGAGFGAALACAWFERYARPREVKIIIDREMARKIDERIVMAWLDGRGLVWMPAGLETIVKGKTR